MSTRVATKDDEFSQDSLEAGETMWVFNDEGRELVRAVLDKKLTRV